MQASPDLHDWACVVHVHSTYSDGTGTVPEIDAAGRQNGLDAVLLTDHDSLEARRRGEERRYGSTLVLVGEEVSPSGENHYLAFGLDREIDHSGLSSAEICAAVADAGGFGFAAHPFSSGSERFRGRAAGIPWRDLDADGLTGVELWSFVTDTAEHLSGAVDALRFVTRPQHVVDNPPARNLAGWDALCQARPVVAIGGLDAHQFGKRIAGRVPLRLMSYARSFRYLRTHALCERPPGGDLDEDRSQLYSALRAGRCYLAMDSLAPARGFDFQAENTAGQRLPMGTEVAAGHWTLRARTPRAAGLRLLMNGKEIARAKSTTLEHRVEDPGVYRVEARLVTGGRPRTWIVSNPIYLR
jgi:hypothetical protein